VSKKPDTAFLYAGVESQQPTASAAQSDLAGKAAKLIARVKALGVADKDLNTSGYSVGPVYTPTGQTVSGYRASEQLQITWHVSPRSARRWMPLSGGPRPQPRCELRAGRSQIRAG
jgi:uncharacterized protein YggE